MAQMLLPGSSATLPEVNVWFVAQEQQSHVAQEAYLFRLAVRIPPDHHGYLDTGDEGFFLPLAFTFPTFNERGVQVDMLAHPAGEHDALARATVLRGTGEFTFRVRPVSPAMLSTNTLALTVHYQICNDVTKLCYPPQTRNLSLPIAPLASTVNTVTETALPSTPASLTLNEQLSTLFKRYMDNLFVAFGLVSVAGILALATPCVYPMLPITAAIFTARGEGSAQRKRAHALIYFLGIIGFYTLLGCIAALTGTALSAVMTNAWVYLAFAVLFAFLGLGMLGVYEFSFFSAFMAKVDTLASHVGGFSGTFVMGATTGLIVSPCVAPITGTILLDITGQAARTHALVASASQGTFLRGALLMAGFGLGLGLPFLIIGLLSSRLPSAGSWLTKTKYILALPTLYFAYTYYMKGMEIAMIATPAAHILLGSIVACGMASVLLFVISWPSKALQYASSGFFYVVGASLLYIFAGYLVTQAPPGITASVPEGLGRLLPTHEVHANLQWWRNFGLAQEQARTEHKALFIDFYANWCANCKAFQKLATSDQQLNAALQEAVLVKIYDTDPIFRTLQQEAHYPELRGVGGQPLLPLFAIYSPQGKLVWKGQDYQAVRTMIAQLNQAKQVTTTFIHQ
jgi:thiol:disulfide interchange protein DsbD